MTRCHRTPNEWFAEAVRCYVEPGVKGAAAGSRFQFERLGYFVVDMDSTPDRLVFGRSVTLADTWAKIAKAQGKK